MKRRKNTSRIVEHGAVRRRGEEERSVARIAIGFGGRTKKRERKTGPYERKTWGSGG